MRTDYYVVSPNSRAYRPAPTRLLRVARRRGGLNTNRARGFTMMQDQSLVLYSKAIITFQFHNNHLLVTFIP
jgi:hypothetical protein